MYLRRELEGWVINSHSENEELGSLRWSRGENSTGVHHNCVDSTFIAKGLYRGKSNQESKGEKEQ